MPKMNKRAAGTAGTSRKQELEQELTGKIIDQAQAVETGKYENTKTNLSRNARTANRMFQIRQGKRRRHPDRLLNQYQTIKEETTNANSAWEKALLHEQKRIEVPTEYKAKDSGMVANQLGLVTTALNNYMKSKYKLERVAPVGY